MTKKKAHIVPERQRRKEGKIKRESERSLSVWRVRLYKYINLFKLSSDMSKLISESFKMHANMAHRQKTRTQSSAREGSG